jgi:hypothetical protein
VQLLCKQVHAELHNRRLEMGPHIAAHAYCHWTAAAAAVANKPTLHYHQPTLLLLLPLPMMMLSPVAAAKGAEG